MTRKQTLKRTLVTALIGASVLFGIHGQMAKDEAQEELTKYKAIYDGLNVYEDGSWAYKEGVEPYFFWNWRGEYAEAWRIYAETGVDVTKDYDTGKQVGVK